MGNREEAGAGPRTEGRCDEEEGKFSIVTDLKDDSVIFLHDL